MKKILFITSIIIGLNSSLLGYNYGTMKQNTIDCKKGHALACSNLGSNYLSKNKNGLAKKYYTRGTELFKEDCKSGNGKACYDLANRFHGTLYSIESNLTAVSKYYHMSCKNKYGKACIELGANYKRGRNGLTKNKEKSLVHYKQGVSYLEHECDKDIAASCKDLSTIYSLNMYGTNDRKKGDILEKKSFELFKELCEHDDDEGCIKTAFAYHHGSSAPVDWVLAKEYYEKSCKLGQESACWKAKDIDIDKQGEYEENIRIRNERFKRLVEEQKKKLKGIKKNKTL